MKLGSARLCLDCDEVHETIRCPTCTSVNFAYIARWVPEASARLSAPEIHVLRSFGQDESHEKARTDEAAAGGRFGLTAVGRLLRGRHKRRG